MSSEPPETIIEIPPEFLREKGPPPALKKALSSTEMTTPCSMPYTVVWTGGPKRGLPITAYCAEPLCIRPGASPGPCTGPRFVPHPQQYTVADIHSPLRRRRVPDAQECVEAAIQCGEKATKITAMKDTRSRREIAHHIALTWRLMRQAFIGEDKWGT